MHELTEKLYGICSAPQVKCIRTTLWLAWARSSAGEADADATASLRCLRLLGTCGLAHYPMQLLPESPGCLVVAVDEPKRTSDWMDAIRSPREHLQPAEEAERLLNALLPEIECTMSSHVLQWYETALAAVAGTIEQLRSLAAVTP